MFHRDCVSYLVKRISNWVTLYKLAQSRLRSENDYKRFQRFQAKLLLEYMREFGIDIKGQIVLDLGSGLGGYSEELSREGGKVVSLDLIMPPYPLEQGVHSIVADALHIPLCDEAVDFVFCASLIEHVADPLLLLTEIQRVLKKGQYCYLSFPPFYSPLGGHEFSPFHYLGERTSLRLHRLFGHKHPDWVIKIYKPPASPTSFTDTYRGWGLHKLTIAMATKIINRVGMEIIEVSPRYLLFNTARWPLLGELLTWHVQFLIRKPTADSPRGKM